LPLGKSTRDRLFDAAEKVAGTNEFLLVLLGNERQSGIPLERRCLTPRRACRFRNAPATSRLAGRQKGFVYWPPGLV